MKEAVAAVVQVAIFLGILFIVVKCFNGSYSPATPAQTQTTSSGQRLPLKVAIVIPEMDRKSGNSIPGLNIDGTSLRLLRPMGRMVVDYLPTVARLHFERVYVISDANQVHDADLVITASKCEATPHTGYRIRGLRMLAARVDVDMSASLEAMVSGLQSTPFSVTAEGSSPHLAMTQLCPAAQLAKTVTSQMDLAVYAACRDMMRQIAGHPQMSRFKVAAK